MGQAEVGRGILFGIGSVVPQVWESAEEQPALPSTLRMTVKAKEGQRLPWVP